MNGIVVGVDGSAAGVAPLRWAVTQARAQRCPVTAVEVRPRVHPLPGSSYASAPPVERLRTRLHDTVSATAATVPDAPEIVRCERLLLLREGLLLADGSPAEPRGLAGTGHQRPHDWDQ